MNNFKKIILILVSILFHLQLVAQQTDTVFLSNEYYSVFDKPNKKSTSIVREKIYASGKLIEVNEKDSINKYLSKEQIKDFNYLESYMPYVNKRISYYDNGEIFVEAEYAYVPDVDYILLKGRNHITKSTTNIKLYNYKEGEKDFTFILGENLNYHFLDESFYRIMLPINILEYSSWNEEENEKFMANATFMGYLKLVSNSSKKNDTYTTKYKCYMPDGLEIGSFEMITKFTNQESSDLPINKIISLNTKGDTCYYAEYPPKPLSNNFDECKLKPNKVITGSVYGTRVTLFHIPNSRITYPIKEDNISEITINREEYILVNNKQEDAYLVKNGQHISWFSDGKVKEKATYLPNLTCKPNDFFNAQIFHFGYQIKMADDNENCQNSQKVGEYLLMNESTTNNLDTIVYLFKPKKPLEISFKNNASTNIKPAVDSLVYGYDEGVKTSSIKKNIFNSKSLIYSITTIEKNSIDNTFFGKEIVYELLADKNDANTIIKNEKTALKQNEITPEIIKILTHCKSLTLLENYAYGDYRYFRYFEDGYIIEKQTLWDGELHSENKSSIDFFIQQHSPSKKAIEADWEISTYYKNNKKTLEIKSTFGTDNILKSEKKYFE